ncbi:hypothetical protein BSKO_04438 [Bryopsis sp. KO-2023]|nr:hypothetical protein BSKO_04438 [Bryopsis sp. KO-2023]
MTDVVKVCPAAAWRKAPFVGDPSEDFDPTADDFDTQAYGEEVVKKNVASIVFVAVISAFLLFFLLWRFTRSMCILCCCKGSCDKKREKNANVLWTKKAFVVSILLVAVGLALIGLTGYGMYNLDVNVTKDGWHVIDSTRDKMTEILDFADHMLDELGGVVGVLDKLEVLVERDINATAIGEDLDCIDDVMTNGLPDFSALQTKLNGLDTSLATTLPGDITVFKTGLVDLKTNTLDPMTVPVDAISSAKASITTLQTDMGDYNDALNALPASHSAAADIAVGNLQTAHNNLGDLNPHITKLQALSTGLQSFADDVSTTPIDDVDSAITSITATLNSMSTDLTDVAGDVRTLSTSFDDMNPCFNSLMDRMTVINRTIIGLPEAVNTAVLQLADVTNAIDDVNSDPTLAELADELDGLVDSLELPGDTGSFSSDLSAAKTNIESVQSQSAAMRTEVDNIVTQLQDVNSGLGAVKSQLDSYPNPGTSGAYTALLAVTNPMKPKVQNAVNGLNDVTTNNAATFTAVDTLESTLPTITSNLETQKGSLDSFDAELAAAPDLGAIVSSLDSVVTTFDDLPSDVLEEPKTLITEIDTQFGGIIGNVTESTQSSLDEVGTQIADTRKDVLSEFETLKDDYEEDSEKYNKQVYQSTLVLYVLSMFFSVGLVVFVVMHFQFGVGLTIFLLLIVLFFYFLIATVLGTVLIMANDGCHNLERMALEQVDEKMVPLARYYLFDEGGPLRQILNDTGTVDLDTVLDQATEVKDEFVDQIRNDYETKEKLNNIMDEMSNVTDTLVVLVDQLEGKVSYDSINPLYVLTKEYFCCKLPDVMHQIWRDLTYIGVLGLVLLFFGFIGLHFLDMMPRVDCCGCTCRRKPSASSYGKIPNPTSTPTKASTSAPLIPDTPTRGQIDTTLV